MTQPRKPIFGFLWPSPDPNAPVDDAYVQSSFVRIPPRGAVRLLALALFTLLLAVLAASAVLAAVSTSWLLVIPLSIVIATLFVLDLRAWTIGTYVNDRGIAVQRLLETKSTIWENVERVVDDGGRVVVHTHSGRVITTTIARWSLDTMGSPEAYDIAKLQLQRWGEQR